MEEMIDEVKEKVSKLDLLPEIQETVALLPEIREAAALLSEIREATVLLPKIREIVSGLPEMKAAIDCLQMRQEDLRTTQLDMQQYLLYAGKRQEEWQENWQRSVLLSPTSCDKADDWGNYIEYIHSLFPLVEILDGPNLSRYGGRRDLGDGAYIMADDLTNINIAYSFGIADDVSWDMAMAENGMDVYMYDHTIEKLPVEHPQFHWKKVGLDAKESSTMKSLPQILDENGHGAQKNMLLKIDIEGMEWGVLDALDGKILGQFAQIAIEFHDICQPQNKEIIGRVLQKLNLSHAPVHLHGNNNRAFFIHHGKCLPDVLEVTYALRERYRMKRVRKNYPTFLDMKNTPNRAEIILGKWGDDSESAF